MPLPTPEKTWLFDVNISNPAGSTLTETYQHWVFAVKQSLTGFASRPWQVAGSCDGSTAGMDGVDRWTDYTKLVWANQGASPKAWIVLKQPYITDEFSVLLWCNNGASSGLGRQAYVSVCSSGYTGGTTSTAPTALGTEVVLTSGTVAGEVGVESPAYTLGTTGLPVTSTTHVLHANDGTATYVFGTRGGISETMWAFFQPSSPISAWTNPFIAILRTGFGSVCTYNTMYTNDHLWTVFNNGVVGLMLGSPTMESSAIGEQITVANEISSVWDISGASIVGTGAGASGRVGRLGVVPDLFWASTGLSEGTTYPADSSFQFAQFGHLVVPWSGVSPNIDGGTIIAVDGDYRDSVQSMAYGSAQAAITHSTISRPGYRPNLGPSGTSVSYLMRAYHTTDPVGYVYWMASGAPDSAGSGAPYPAGELTDIVVVKVS